MSSQPNKSSNAGPSEKTGRSRTCLLVAVIVIALGVVPLCGCGVMTVVYALTLKSVIEADANYQAAMARAEKNERVQQLIGKPIKAHFFTGGAHESENDRIDIRVPISGPNGRGTLIVKNQVKLVEVRGQDIELAHGLVMRVEVDDETIDLLAADKDDEPAK